MSEPKKTLVEGLKVEEGRAPLNSDWPECEEFYNLMQQYRHALVSVPSLVLDRYNAIKAWLRQQETAQTHEMVVRNLAMLVRRLIHRIRSKYKAPDDAVAKQAWDYLIGEGLQGSVLRKEAAQHLKREQEPAVRELEPTEAEAELIGRMLAAQPPQELVSLRGSGMHAELEKWGTLDFHYVGCKCAICQREPWRQQVIGDLSAGEQTNQIERLNILARAALTRGELGGK